MILTVDVIKKIRNVGLDAEPDTDFYNDDTDIIPAIDSSVMWIMSVLDFAKSNNKKIQEITKELQRVFVYRTSRFSRIELDNELFTIDAIYPLPTTSPMQGAAVPATNYPDGSTKMTNLIHVDSYYSAERSTIEEWTSRNKNPFMRGFKGKCSGELTEGSKNPTLYFSYLDPFIFKDNGKPEIEIKPQLDGKLVSMFCVVNHPNIKVATDNIFFPKSIFNVVYEKALQFISYSQGDNTTIWSVTEADVTKLIKSVQ